jgi:MSHA pilin protein MshD
MIKSRRAHISVRAGFSLFEVVGALLITTILITASTRAIAAAKMRERQTLDQINEVYLANELLNEIQLQAFSEPDEVASFGLEPGESGANRLLYDDIDDYDGLIESPPKRRDGSSWSTLANVTRSVKVDWISDLPPHTAATSGTGLKRVEVTIIRGSKVILRIVGYRSAGFQNRMEL